MILDRATIDFRDHQKTSTTQVTKKNSSADQTPVLPWRSSSPERDQERDQTQKSPLHFDDDDDDDESFEDSAMDVEEENTEEQVLGAKEEKLRRLNRDSQTQYRFPPHHPLQAIQRNDPLNTSVRHNIGSHIKVMPTSVMLPMKHQQLEHVHIPSELHIPSSYYPGKALGLCSNNNTSIFDILDSALSVASESRIEGVFSQ